MGVQPIVAASANGAERAEVAVGQPVEFAGKIEVPSGGGTVISARWDFDGSGDFAIEAQLKHEDDETIALPLRHAFRGSGTFFPALLVTSQREGNEQTPFARILNLGRVRVVVSPGQTKS